MGFYDEALEITERAIKRVMPDQAVKKALEEMNFKKLSGDADNGKVVIIAIGKAAWQMAKAAKIGWNPQRMMLQQILIKP